MGKKSKRIYMEIRSFSSFALEILLFFTLCSIKVRRPEATFHTLEPCSMAIGHWIVENKQFKIFCMKQELNYGIMDWVYWLDRMKFPSVTIVTTSFSLFEGVNRLHFIESKELNRLNGLSTSPKSDRVGFRFSHIKITHRMNEEINALASTFICVHLPNTTKFKAKKSIIIYLKRSQ